MSYSEAMLFLRTSNSSDWKASTLHKAVDKKNIDNNLLHGTLKFIKR